METGAVPCLNHRNKYREKGVKGLVQHSACRGSHKRRMSPPVILLLWFGYIYQLFKRGRWIFYLVGKFNLSLRLLLRVMNGLLCVWGGGGGT